MRAYLAGAGARGRMNMFTALIGAVQIADIIVFVVLGLGLVIGLIGGLAKAFKGLFASLAIILISLLIVGVTVVPISSTSIGQSLSGTFESKAEGWGAAFSSPVYIMMSGDGQPVKDGYCVDIDGERVQLENAAGDGALAKIKGKMAVALAKKYVTADNQGQVALAKYAADSLTRIIFDVALFIIYCIALGVLFFLLRKMFANLFNRRDENGDKSVGLKVLDKTLGAVVAVGFALLALLLVFAIIKLAAPAGSKVAQFFENANVAGTLYTKNPMSKVFTKLF